MKSIRELMDMIAATQRDETYDDYSAYRESDIIYTPRTLTPMAQPKKKLLKEFAERDLREALKPETAKARVPELGEIVQIAAYPDKIGMVFAYISETNHECEREDAKHVLVFRNPSYHLRYDINTLKSIGRMPDTEKALAAVLEHYNGYGEPDDEYIESLSDYLDGLV